ncbi:MAG TPA: hypothetical protein VOA41_12875 [Candidatus Dormibacteraeota bacterium]|nr:hypothetical protein [Candidatus Dormibacteraeota bacterium]
MKLKFADLWRWEGTVDRGTDALVGVLGFAIKHNLDRFIAGRVFHRSWGIFNHWIPVSRAVRIARLSARRRIISRRHGRAFAALRLGRGHTNSSTAARRWFASMVSCSFFSPLLNLFFFALLCVLPQREQSGNLPLESISPKAPLLARILPKSAMGSAAMSLAITLPFGLVFTVFGASILQEYGWGLFVALPFSLGLASTIIYGYGQPRSYGSCVLVACFSTIFLGCALLAVAVEGIVCLVMAGPLALALSLMGGSIGYWILRARWYERRAPAVLSLVLFLVPAIQFIDRAAAFEPPVFAVRTALEIQAPPEAVWREVVASTEIAAPTELLFRAGIAYPVRAEIHGRGPGAVRLCIFSTGPFVEPIEIWDAPRQLKFSVTSNPVPMQEWTPHSHIEPPHLHGFLVSSGGQFFLTPRAGGGTLLEGTTWYRHSLWPAAYWRLWSDAIIHRIHLRVLRHIKHRTEKTVH